MSSIFTEKEDLKNMKSIIATLREDYASKLKNYEPRFGDARLLTKLNLQWPGDEIITQVLRDTFELLVKYDIDPKDIR